MSLKHLIISLSLLLTPVFNGLLVANPVYAAFSDNAKSAACQGITDTTGGACDTSGATSIDKTLTTVIDIFSIIVGIIAVIMIIVAGVKFITSGGDSNKTASARSTVLYAIIGLVIVALAQVIVRFVLNKAAT